MVLDTTVLVYAVGGDHALAGPARSIVEAVAAGRLRATTTVEVIQEFVHVRARRRPRDDAAALGRSFATLLTPLITVGPDDLDSGLRVFEGSERLGSFDAVLAASAIARGAAALVTADTAFESVVGIPVLSLGEMDLAEHLE